MPNNSFVLDVNVIILFSTSVHAKVKLYVMFEANYYLADAANKTLALSDKLDFDIIDHAGLAAELMHANFVLMNLLCLGEI